MWFNFCVETWRSLSLCFTDTCQHEMLKPMEYAISNLIAKYRRHWEGFGLLVLILNIFFVCIVSFRPHGMRLVHCVVWDNTLVITDDNRVKVCGSQYYWPAHTVLQRDLPATAGNNSLDHIFRKWTARPHHLYADATLLLNYLCVFVSWVYCIGAEIAQSV